LRGGRFVFGAQLRHRALKLVDFRSQARLAGRARCAGDFVERLLDDLGKLELAGNLLLLLLESRGVAGARRSKFLLDIRLLGLEIADLLFELLFGCLKTLVLTRRRFFGRSMQAREEECLGLAGGKGIRRYFARLSDCLIAIDGVVRFADLLNRLQGGTVKLDDRIEMDECIATACLHIERRGRLLLRQGDIPDHERNQDGKKKQQSKGSGSPSEDEHACFCLFAAGLHHRGISHLCFAFYEFRIEIIHSARGENRRASQSHD
jgi:hypothetical protein